MVVVYIYLLNSENYKNCAMERYNRNEHIHWFKLQRETQHFPVNQFIIHAQNKF